MHPATTPTRSADQHTSSGRTGPHFEIDLIAYSVAAAMASALCIALFSFRSWDAVSAVFIAGSLAGVALVFVGTLILELVDEKFLLLSLIGAVFLAAGGVLQLIGLIASVAVGGGIPWAIQLFSRLAGF